MGRRSWLHKRLMRKSGIVDDLLYSKQNLGELRKKRTWDSLMIFLIAGRSTSTAMKIAIRGRRTCR